ncbi:lipase family protein [Smaragdicoccus niigatensis]|uniref:lipase family protein n=1 Tax=Smaragdicoccus niigatensis TaxID=359359 RepID=UPI0003724FBD|nr:lipase family protein [Smaragdicoccus niigatensis]
MTNAAISSKVKLGALLSVTAVALTTHASAQQMDPHAPGTVTEITGLPLGRIVGSTVTARISYWSTGPDGPMLSSSALFVPAGQPPRGGWPIVARAHGTTGIGDDCAPSRTGLDDFVSSQVDQWLALGFAVVLTDYVGLGTPGIHPYLDGPSEASSVLDAVRAARKVDVNLSNRFAAIGESQGGHATLFVANLAASYAPELDFRGAVAIVPPSNFDQLLPITATLTPPQSHEGLMRRLGFVLTGLRAARPDLNVNSYMTPLGVQVLDALEIACNGARMDELTRFSVNDLIAKPLAGTPLAAALEKTLEIPTSGYHRPIMLAHALGDELIPTTATDKLISDLRAGGANVTDKAYPTGHVDSVFASEPDTVNFTRQLFENND